MLDSVVTQTTYAEQPNSFRCRTMSFRYSVRILLRFPCHTIYLPTRFATEDPIDRDPGPGIPAPGSRRGLTR